MNYRSLPCLLLFFCFTLAQGQQPQSPDDQPHIQPRNLPPEPKEEPKEEPKQEPPRDSSSRDSQINLEGPSKSSGGGADVHEMLPYNPHKAAKDIEVGEFYLKRKNYRAALDRFNEALEYKPNDAQATFRLAQTQEKLGLNMQAVQSYNSYLKIVPEGPFAKDAQEALKKLGPQVQASGGSRQASDDAGQLIQQGEAYLAKNDFEEAHETFVKALQIAPDDPVANYRLAESLQGLERLDEARFFYKKYLSLQPNGKLAAEAKRQIGEINLILGKQ